MQSRAGLVLLLLAGLTPSLRAQVKLEWKLREGDVSRWQTDQDIRLTFKGAAIEKVVHVTRLCRYEVLKKDATGAVVRQIIESVDVDENNPQGDEISRVLKRLKGAGFSLLLNARMQVIGLEGYEDFLQKVAGDSPELGHLAAFLVSEAKAREEMTAVFGLILPANAVQNGTRWEGEASHALGPFGRFLGNGDHTVVIKNDRGGTRLAQIDVYWNLRYALPPQTAGTARLPIVGGELAMDDARGRYYFDPTAGKLVRFESKLRFKGRLTVKQDGSESPLEMEQETHTRGQLVENPSTPRK